MRNKNVLSASVLFAASMSAHALGDFDVEVNDTLQFWVKEMVAGTSCETINLKITHVGSMGKTVMGHNWVLSKTEDMRVIAADGVSAGIDNNFLKPDDARVLAYTKIVGGGASDSISFSPGNLEADPPSKTPKNLLGNNRGAARGAFTRSLSIAPESADEIS